MGYNSQQKMKKLFLLFFIAGLYVSVYGQNKVNNVNININNQDGSITNKECPYQINGICITEDIGGVTATIVYENDCTWAIFTNYNGFAVNVLYEIKSNYSHEQSEVNHYLVQNGTISNIVLGVKATKKVKLNQTYNNHPFKAYQGFKDKSGYYSIKAMIVKKLSI